MATDSGASITPSSLGLRLPTGFWGESEIRGPGASWGSLVSARGPPTAHSTAGLTLCVTQHHAMLVGHLSLLRPLQGRRDLAPEGQATLQGE